jgi:hypothetical protein
LKDTFAIYSPSVRVVFLTPEEGRELRAVGVDAKGWYVDVLMMNPEGVVTITTGAFLDFTYVEGGYE